MAFNPQTKLVATNAHSLADLERQFGDVGLHNGPRTGPSRRSTVSNEAFLTRRFVLHLVASSELRFPISVDHEDRPDFRIRHAGGEILLEVTEACPASNGKRFAKQTEGVHQIRHYSESGLGQAQKDLVAQLQKAIDEKRGKGYAADGALTLLIYPNSDASQWVSFFDRKPRELFSELDTSSLNSLYLFWNADFIKVSGMRP